MLILFLIFFFCFRWQPALAWQNGGAKYAKLNRPDKPFLTMIWAM
jgi:hypothetical protein